MEVSNVQTVVLLVFASDTRGVAVLGNFGGRYEALFQGVDDKKLFSRVCLRCSVHGCS